MPEGVRVHPAQVDFGPVVVGQAASATIELVNEGKAPLPGTWRLRGEAFLGDDGFPSRAEVGSTPVTVRCAPPRVGVYDGVLEIALDGFAPLTVPLACEGLPTPACEAATPCRVSTWDVSAGRCVESSVVDGTPCDEADVCLVRPTCQAGRCVGAARSCDDGDPCTLDSCHPTRGCEFSAGVTCPGVGPCGLGRCVPRVGCVVEDAPDGTPCGPRRSCTLADVCVDGACVARDPPDGFECAPASPCSGAGHCAGDVCVRPPASVLQPQWLIEAPQPDGGPPGAWSDVFATRDGGLVVASYFVSPPRIGPGTATPIDLPSGLVRRCISWLDWLVCGDYPGSSAAPVSAIDPGTGLVVWSYQGVARDVPEFARPSVQFFTARLAVLSESELLALYESRTLTAQGGDPRCRNFALVVLDRRGQPVRSRFLVDPLFDECTHPHSYGVAVDASGNLYVAFTSSGEDNPANPTTGTTIFSFTPGLQSRWRIVVPSLGGGELAVGDGLLFHEWSATAWSTATGMPAAQLPREFGDGVIGEGLAVASARDATSLFALDTATAMPAATWPLEGRLGRHPLSAARWDTPWGPREVVMAFTLGPTLRLEAYELATGAAAFSCPVALPEAPKLTVVGQGSLAGLLSPRPASGGPRTCDQCDPRFAMTRMGLVRLPLPGISPSRARWPGAWGGEGHPHRERR